MERNAHAVLDAAYDAGVRYFDAARSYGLAEAFLSSWLARRDIAPGSVVVGSKWGYTYTADWQVDAATHEVKDHSVDVFRRQLAESRDLLGLHLAVYQIHSATIESGVLDDPVVINALADARGRGLHIGLSVSGPRQAETIWRAIDVYRDGVRMFETVQATWNLMERASEQALVAANDAGLGVIIKEALANGRLAARTRGDGERSGSAALRRAATELGVTEDALALASALSRPWAGVVLSGATTARQLASNVRAVDIAIPDEVFARLDALRVDSEMYWRERSSLPWN
jgi:aryl-alcohol dehydrogenase-like predicted oxidoreductase